MTEIIDISSKEYEDIVSFQNKEIDHFFIQPDDEPNKTMVCHGTKNGEIYFNGRFCILSEIVDEVKEELRVDSEYFYLDVICCHSNTIIPYIEKGCSIRPRHLCQGNFEHYYNFYQIKFTWD